MCNDIKNNFVQMFFVIFGSSFVFNIKKNNLFLINNKKLYMVMDECTSVYTLYSISHAKTYSFVT